jgi:VanZ family protein
MGLIFWLSSQSALIEIEDEMQEKAVFKAAHIIAYAVLAWFWWRALAPQRQISWTIFSSVFALTTLYGISDEIHQLFVPGRYGRVADVLFDASGALAMILVLRRVKWLRAFPEALSVFASDGEASLFQL